MIEKNFVIRAVSAAKNKETLVQYFAIDTDSGEPYFTEYFSQAQLLTKEEAQREFDKIQDEKDVKFNDGTVQSGRSVYNAAGLCNARPESHVIFEIMEVQLVPRASFARDAKISK